MKTHKHTGRSQTSQRVARGSMQRMVRAMKLVLPKIPRAKRGKRFSQAIWCLKTDLEYMRSNPDDAMNRITAKDYEDAIAALETLREKQPHRPNAELCHRDEPVDASKTQQR